MKKKYLERKTRKAAKRRLAPGSAPGDMMAKPQPEAPRKMRLPIYFSDLIDRVPSENEIDELVSSFERGPTFLMLAMLNSFLSFYEQDDRQAYTYLQGFLFKNLTSDDLFSRAQRKFPNEEMGSRPMFHRQQMLVLLKKILLLAGTNGGQNPNGPNNKKARHALGELALMTNDFLNPRGQQKRLNRRLGSGLRFAIL
jgi:hypothetical protein